MANSINFKLEKLFRTPAPWETEAEHNRTLSELRKIKIAPDEPGTDQDDDRDPRDSSSLPD